MTRSDYLEPEQWMLLSTMVGVQQLGGEWSFGPRDAKAMKRDAGIILQAMTQKVGTCCRDRDACRVTDEMFDRALVTLVCEGMALALSGVLDSIYPTTEVVDE